MRRLIGLALLLVLLPGPAGWAQAAAWPDASGSPCCDGEGAGPGPAKDASDPDASDPDAAPCGSSCLELCCKVSATALVSARPLVGALEVGRCLPCPTAPPSLAAHDSLLRPPR
jgi:hypothetical protein